MTESALLAGLRKEIREQGWGRKATGSILLQLLINLIIVLTGTSVYLMVDNPLAQVCGIVASTAGSMGVATIAHTASHYAASDRRWVNELLTYFGYPFFVGLSATYWRYKHLTIHHRSTNVIGVDEDINLAPWFAMSRSEVERSRGWRRWYYERVQWLVFPVVLAVTGFHMQKSGLVYLIRKLSNHSQLRRAHLKDLLAVFLFFVVWVGLPALYWPAVDVITFYLLRIGLMSYAMFVVLAPAHFPAEAARIDDRLQNSEHLLLLQTATTINFRTGFLGKLICSGLQYQIEHHLFPEISHVHYPKMSVRIEKFCREHGFPYRSYQWESVLWKSLLVLRKPPDVVTSAEMLRGTVQKTTYKCTDFI